MEEIRESIGADSLGFVSLEGLIEATTLPADRLCMACFSGEYPVPVAEAEQGKFSWRRSLMPARPGHGCRAGRGPLRRGRGRHRRRGAGGRR